MIHKIGVESHVRWFFELRRRIKGFGMSLIEFSVSRSVFGEIWSMDKAYIV